MKIKQVGSGLALLFFCSLNIWSAEKWPEASFEEKSSYGLDRNIAAYQQELAARLCRRYNNQPKYASTIAKVELKVARRPRKSMDGKETQVEFSQLVYNKWGERVPDLEKEYYVVTFGHGQPRRTRTKPSVSIGMNADGGYSESEAVEGGLLGALRKEQPTEGDRQTPIEPPAEKKAPVTPKAPANSSLSPATGQPEAAARTEESLPEISSAEPEAKTAAPDAGESSESRKKLDAMLAQTDEKSPEPPAAEQKNEVRQQLDKLLEQDAPKNGEPETIQPAPEEIPPSQPAGDVQEPAKKTSQVGQASELKNVAEVPGWKLDD